MTRKEFLKNFAALGIGLPFLSTMITSCDKDVLLNPDFDIDFSGKVLIIGAGAAGLTAGYILNKYNIDFEIIEAASIYGGRVKKSGNFADVPLDLGAEWIHTDPSILATLVNDDSVNMDIDIISYRPQTHSTWEDNKLRSRNYARHFYGEHKFKNTTWFDYFEKFIVPDIANKIVYNSPITEVNYTDDKVIVKTANNETYEADKVLMTVSTSILKSDSITFIPEFSDAKKQALDRAFMPDGIKAFIEFSEKFYPDMIYVEPVEEDSTQEKLFYDAMFRKDASKHVLALFNVGISASVYTNMATEEEIINTILAELDAMFDGKATETYQKHIVQNWSKETYVQGSYTYFTSDEEASVKTLAEAINNKIYFAGEAMTSGSSATVHGAAESAYETIQTMF